MTRSRKIVLAMLLVPFVAVAAWLTYHETRTPQNEKEVLHRMIELQQEGRYDKAVKVVQKWMKDNRRNVSHDEFLYLQITFVCITKAQRKPSIKDEAIRDAEFNLEKSLELSDKGDPKGVWLDGIGASYEALGDLSGKRKCEFYEKAKQSFTRQLLLTKGDSYTAYGKTIQLEPIRAEIRKRLDELNEKLGKTGCEMH